MAIDNRLQIFDENDNPVDYDIMATDVKFADGKDLPTKLDELEDEIGEGGYTPPPGGIPKTDLAPAVQQTLDDVAGKVDKVTGKGLSKNDYTDTDKAKVDGLKPVATSGSYNDLTDKPTIPTVPTMDSQPTLGNTTHMVSSDGVAAAIAGGQVTVTTNGDGTFTIHAGGNDYTVNLNHTHENMAKLVVDTAANLPDVSEMESDTIYGEVDDGEISVLYVGGLPFYGGGGVSTPVLRQPTDGSTIDVGRIASGGSSVTKTITVKGRGLTQALVVGLTGTGFSADKQSISAADANVGTTLTIACTNTADEAAGTLTLASSEVTCDCDLIANMPTYEDIVGVKLTGLQYIMLNYYTNPNTKLEIDMQFIENSNKNSSSAINYWLGTGVGNTEGAFFSNTGQDSSSWNSLFYWFEKGYVSSVWSENYGNSIFSRSTWVYDNNAVVFQGTTTQTETKTTTQTAKLLLGAQYIASRTQYDIFNRHDLAIFSLKISEGSTILLNLVPKLMNGAVPGLYDTVNNVFYRSETANELVAITNQ